jgi:hypothetical protein
MRDGLFFVNSCCQCGHLATCQVIAAIIGSTIGSYMTVKASPSFVKFAFALIIWFFAGEIALRLLPIIYEATRLRRCDRTLQHRSDGHTGC